MDHFKIPKVWQGGPPLTEYVLQDEIGTGKYGIVCSYKRRERQWFAPQKISLPEKIAVKTIIISKSIKTDRELEIGLSVSHPNIVKTFGVGVERHLLHLKMELANADLFMLKTMLDVHKFQPTDIRLLAHQFISGLCYLHENSISHRDLKPQNILAFWNAVDVSNKPDISSLILKLSDFGLSRIIPDDPGTATAVGTRSYMAPEVALAFSRAEWFYGDYRKADVFSAGVIIYEMLNGYKPFSEADLLKSEEISLPETCIAPEEQDIMKNIAEMLKWTAVDRCDVEFAKRNLRPCATSKYMKEKDILGNTAIHRAARDGALDEAKWLLDSGDDPNRPRQNNIIPLHSACSKGHLSVSQLLIERGADVNRSDEDGWTPLHYSCHNAHLSVVQLLIDTGANINQGDARDWTPLHYACRFGHLLVAQLLLESRADVNSSDEYGETPLHSACRFGHLLVVTLLIEKGADINKGKEGGCTPLFCACANNYLEVAKRLLENGADPIRSELFNNLFQNHGL